MAAQSPPNAPRLPIATLATSRGLLRLYARLKGEIAKARSGEDAFLSPDEAADAMTHIAALMPLLGVSFDPRALKPVRTRVQIGPLAYGEVRSGILAALKSSRGWMTYPELADAILRKRGIDLAQPQGKHFLQKLREATHALAAAGAVEKEKALKQGDSGELQRWRLSTTLFRR